MQETLENTLANLNVQLTPNHSSIPLFLPALLNNYQDVFLKSGVQGVGMLNLSLENIKPLKLFEVICHVCQV